MARSRRLVGTNADASSRTSHPWSLGLGDDLERVLHARVVRLRREGEQPWSVDRGRGGQRAGQLVPVDAQFGTSNRHVDDVGAGASGELTDAVDRVVVVRGERERAAGAERVGVTHQLQRAGRVGREDAHVVIARHAEEGEHRVAGPFHGSRSRRATQHCPSAGCPAPADRGTPHGPPPGPNCAARRRCSRGRPCPWRRAWRTRVGADRRATRRGRAGQPRVCVRRRWSSSAPSQRCVNHP